MIQPWSVLNIATHIPQKGLIHLRDMRRLAEKKAPGIFSPPFHDFEGRADTINLKRRFF
jgi:hypothetical protein